MAKHSRRPFAADESVVGIDINSIPLPGRHRTPGLWSIAREQNRGALGVATGPPLCLPAAQVCSPDRGTVSWNVKRDASRPALLSDRVPRHGEMAESASK